MTTKKLTGKLAAGVRKIKEAPSPSPAKPRPGRVAASQHSPREGTPARTRPGPPADLHPARVWPD